MAMLNGNLNLKNWNDERILALARFFNVKGIETEVWKRRFLEALKAEALNFLGSLGTVVSDELKRELTQELGVYIARYVMVKFFQPKIHSLHHNLSKNDFGSMLDDLMDNIPEQELEPTPEPDLEVKEKKKRGRKKKEKVIDGDKTN